MGLSRRRLLQGAALLGAGATLAGCRALNSKAIGAARVLVVGGGFGGATVAKTLRMLDPGIKVSLIEPKAQYLSCPGSNGVLAGLTDLVQLTRDYQVLQDRYGVEIIADQVIDIQSSRREVVLAAGQRLRYDRLIMSPGIDFRWNAIEGYDEAAAEQFPHAWQAGPQTLLLARQLQQLKPGGVLLMSIPADPYRCPPGPYERASLMAYWLRRHNPRAKILLLDHKRSFSKQAQFEAVWKREYGFATENSLIEWFSLADNPLVRLDTSTRTVVSDFGDRFKADVLNIIPPQRAAKLATQFGLVDASGWCPIEPRSAMSGFDPFIHIIGDAAQFAPMPKSAFAANSQAKACAIAVADLLNERIPRAPHWLNTCYSLVTAEKAISVAGVYKLDTQGRVTSVQGAGGVSSDLSETALSAEARFARAAHNGLLASAFG